MSWRSSSAIALGLYRALSHEAALTSGELAAADATHEREELAEMLRVDELDLAFLSITERIGSHGLGLQQLVSEELVTVLPPGHRLATRRQVGIAELCDDEFIGYRDGSRLRLARRTPARSRRRRIPGTARVAFTDPAPG